MYIMPTCLSKCIHLVDLSFLSHFGFYDENEHVVEFQHQPVCAYLCTTHVYAFVRTFYFGDTILAPVHWHKFAFWFPQLYGSLDTHV